jgi:hypothetical protein
MQRRPPYSRTERWGARLHKNYVCFLVLCPHCVQFENDANRVAIGIELKSNVNAVMVILNCKIHSHCATIHRRAR